MLLDDALRGFAWPGDAQTPYPRADPLDFDRLPVDTWSSARLPVGVRLELTGDAQALEIDYSCATDELGYRGPGAGSSFVAWRGGREVAQTPASIEGGTARLALDTPEAEPGEVVTVYLPEGMRPTIFDIRAIGGTLVAAPRGAIWLAYGDSVTEGWVASGPAGSWPAITARRYGLDVVNLGYAGAARGEIATAEQIAALQADVISIAYGTNCWSRTPQSRALFRENLRAFLAIVREGHPATPLVVASPIVFPEAESAPNRLGATLSHLRAEVEDVVTSRRRAGDKQLFLVRGLPLLTTDQLPDGSHPGDQGHHLLADAIGGAVCRARSHRSSPR
jgi:lysophospholipase L1-like esterase